MACRGIFVQAVGYSPGIPSPAGLLPVVDVEPEDEAGTHTEPEDEANTDAHDEEADANSEAEVDAELDGEPEASAVGGG